MPDWWACVFPPILPGGGHGWERDDDGVVRCEFCGHRWRPWSAPQGQIQALLLTFVVVALLRR